MRNLALLVGIYFLALAMFPCGDSFLHQDSLAETNISTEHTASEHADICSSLCSCACCGQITYQESELVFSFDVKANHKETIEHYLENVTQNFSGFVWQPPKSSSSYLIS